MFRLKLRIRGARLPRKGAATWRRRDGVVVVDVEELPETELAELLERAESVHVEGPAFRPGPVRDLVELAMPGRSVGERGEVLSRLAALSAGVAA